MADLITPGDIEARVGRPLTDAEQNRLAAVVRDVSAAIRSYTGQTITLVEDDEVRLRVVGGQIRLPQRPVVEVSAVTSTTGTALSYEWNGIEHADVTTWAGNYWPTHQDLVDVTYTHGYATVPDDIVAVACQVAIRSLAVAIDSTAMQQESIGGYSYTLGGAAANGALGFLAGERQVLDRYRRRHRTLQL